MGIYIPVTCSSFQITFSSDTELESGYYFLYITDMAGNNISGSPFLGISLARQTKSVQSNSFKIRLKTNKAGAGYGFRITGITPLF